MKAITEAIVRSELKATKPDVYYIPEGKILSPAAREYLNQMQIEIDFERNRAKREKLDDQKEVEKKASLKSDSEPKYVKSRYVDYETGAGYDEKPEHMTQLFSNQLVDKDHPRISYRGQLDHLQAEIIFAQCLIGREENSGGVIADLDDILRVLREMMRCEVLEEEFENETIIGLNHDELRDHSHHPQKYYHVKQMLLPESSMGLTYSLLNLIRTSIREVEVTAVHTFKESRRVARPDIVRELNRLSSALHIMMCKYQAGEYK